MFSIGIGINTIYMSLFPSQKLSLAEKLKVDDVTKKHWGHNCVDFLIENANWDDREEIFRLKRVVEGETRDEDYKYVLNPYNTQLDKYKRFGAKLRNLNILAPVRDLYLGEFGKRFKNIQVLESNPTDDNLYKQGLNILTKNYYTQKSINELNALGINTEKESKDQPPLKEVIAEYDREFDANRVITGQETLDFLKYDKELDDKYQDIYQDWIECGRAFTYKGISFNDVDFEHVPAEELSIPKNSSSSFIEDGSWAVRRRIAPIHEILDKFHDVLEDDTKTYLNEKLTNDSGSLKGGFTVLPTQYISSTDELNNTGFENKEGLEYYHVVWRSWKKVGVLNYIDQLGQPQEIEVDETYKLDKEHGDLDITWDWISEVWEGYSLEDEGHYWNIRPLPYNRMALNNSSLQKLPYNGRVLKTVSGNIKSIIKTGEPYQALYNIVSYQREKIINKNKDKILLMPQGLIPKGKGGWDEEKFMYFAHANSMAVFDETVPSASLALQGIKVLDMGLGNYIKDMSALLADIKYDWWEAIGMNRQRYGDTNSSDGKGVNEQAIFRSAIISEELNRKFEKFQEKDYAGMLDLSKLAYIDGKKGKYVNSQQREAFLSINPDDAIRRLESDFNVFVRNSNEEYEKLQGLKEYAFSYAQNGGKAKMFMEMLDTTNFTKGKEYISKMEELEQQRIDAMEERKNEVAENIETSRRESEQLKLDADIYKADKDYDKAIDVKLLEIGNNPETDTNESQDTEQEKMNNHKISIDNEEINLKKKDLNRKQKETNAKVKSLASNSNNSNVKK